MKEETADSSAKILVVDDDEVSRQKMTLAVTALGYLVQAVDSGETALDRLRDDSFDLVLLDIVMPGMDGYDVLNRMKSDPVLREIPVVVISALESDMDQVVKAIELGAEDFLPKSFERVLLRARINTCVDKKRRRDREIEYLREVDRLTGAATVLEKGKFNPDFLGLDSVCARPDALGKLARVFADMARQVYQRERKLNQQVRTLKGVLLLFAVGVVFGLKIPLTRMASGLEAHPFGLTLWIEATVAFCCISVCLYRGNLPKLSLESVKFFVVWGAICAVGEVLLFWVAQSLQASVISIILVTEGFIVFAFAAFMSIEAPKAKRLIGIGAGFIGVLMLIVSGETAFGVGNWVWVVIALIVPASYALEDIIVAARIPQDCDIVGAVGLSSLATAMLTLPIVIAFDDHVPLSLALGQLEIVITLLALVSIGGSLLLVQLITSAGAVFASQVGYVLTFAGIAWSILLLGESLPLIAWFALGVMVIGLILVEPKEEAEAVPQLPETDHAFFHKQEQEKQIVSFAD